MLDGARTGDNRSFSLLMIDAFLTTQLCGRDSRRSYRGSEERIIHP
jgi:hypothetical protein